MTVLAIIPARGQSKGVRRKNLYPLRDKPLVFWTIQAAQKLSAVSEVVVSTEDTEIAETARSFGVANPIIRPPELAEDTTPGVDPIIHAAETRPNFSWLLVLQPTSPMRSVEDIEGILEFQRHTGADSVVSVTRVEDNPQLFFSLQKDHTLTLLMAESFQMNRRQDVPKFHKLNGAMYLVSRTWLLENRTLVAPSTLGYEMPIERSIDIDTYDDFVLAETLMGAVHG